MKYYIIIAVSCLLSQCTAVFTQSPDGSLQFSGTVAEPPTVTPQKK